MKIKNGIIIYHSIITIIFVYIFVQFLTMKSNNAVYRFYSQYIMNRYCIILYILLILIIMKYDKFTSILLLIMIVSPFKCAIKEFYQDNSNSTSSSNSSYDKNVMSTIYRPTEPVIVNPTLPSIVNDSDFFNVNIIPPNMQTLCWL